MKLVIKMMQVSSNGFLSMLHTIKNGQFILVHSLLVLRIRGRYVYEVHVQGINTEHKHVYVYARTRMHAHTHTHIHCGLYAHATN